MPLTVWSVLIVLAQIVFVGSEMLVLGFWMTLLPPVCLSILTFGLMVVVLLMILLASVLVLVAFLPQIPVLNGSTVGGSS